MAARLVAAQAMHDSEWMLAVESTVTRSACPSCGVFGIGNGRQKLFFLPEPHTDFIFSIIGEELGFIGAGLLLALFGFLAWRGLRIAQRSNNRFAFYAALGLTLMIVMQALINMSVALCLLPTKGISLPLVSYGGSSLIASLLAIGILLNLSQQTN